MKPVILIVGLLVAGSASADDYADLIARAFANVDDTFHETWAFTETKIEDDMTLVGRYDPTLPTRERWQLLSVDGRKPTAAEIDDYADGRENHFDEDRRENDETDFVDYNSVELIEETADHWLFNFEPAWDEDEDEETREMMGHLRGRVKVIKDGHYPALLEMKNDKPIRPMPGVKISQFVTRIAFGPAIDGGPVVMLSQDVVIAGRAALVISFDEAESTGYSEFEYVGD